MRTITNFPIGLGCGNITGTWDVSQIGAANEKRAIAAFEAALESGITLYDLADVYAFGACETMFGKCLKAVPGARERICIATKGGILLPPDGSDTRYDLSGDYLRGAIDASLRRIGVEKIDIYYLHRPDPLAHPQDTAAALDEAVSSGKVGAVGVSNYFPEQMRALQKFLDAPLVCNQLNLSLQRLRPFYEGWDFGENALREGRSGDGVLDFCMAENIVPVAYSPLGAGRIARGEWHDEREKNLGETLRVLAEKYARTPVQIALAWLLSHPSGIVPLVGSNDPGHIREAAAAPDLRLSRDDWYLLFTTAWGRKVP